MRVLSIITYAASGGEPCMWGHATSIEAKAYLQGPGMTLPRASCLHEDAFCRFAALLKIGGSYCMHQPHILLSTPFFPSVLVFAVALCDIALSASTSEQHMRRRREGQRRATRRTSRTPARCRRPPRRRA